MNMPKKKSVTIQPVVDVGLLVIDAQMDVSYGVSSTIKALTAAQKAHLYLYLQECWTNNLVAESLQEAEEALAKAQHILNTAKKNWLKSQKRMSNG
jgi:hypothetical protein